jgi:AP-2 complex subunit mu-1
MRSCTCVIVCVIVCVCLCSGKYEPVERAVVWRVRRFVGGEECTLRGEVELIASTKPKPWVRPPINVDFQVPMFTSSGLHVRSLKVLPQKEQYTTTKWVRYVTRAGSYQIRI